MRENEKMNIEAIGEELIEDMYWKNYPRCPIDNKPMEIVYSNSGHYNFPEMPTEYFYEIKYRCLHCFHMEWERDGT